MPKVEDVTLSGLIGGLPTLHEVAPVAGYPEDSKLTAAYDERASEPLPLEKVHKARGHELDKMEEHLVKKDITWEEAKAKCQTTRTEFAAGVWPRNAIHTSGTTSFRGRPPLKAHRMVVTAACTSKQGKTVLRRLIARYDVLVAFFHAVATGKIAVVPLKDLDQGLLWYLLKAMNGTREASKQWAKRIMEVMTAAGFPEVASVPGLFYHPEWDVTLSCHGDDFLAEGEAHELERLDELMTNSCEPTTNWADLSAKPLAGSRITELLRMMSLHRRGITAALLARSLKVVAAQGGD